SIVRVVEDQVPTWSKERIEAAACLVEALERVELRAVRKAVRVGLPTKDGHRENGVKRPHIIQAALGRVDKRDVGSLTVPPPGSLQYMVAHIGTDNAGGREPLGESSRFFTGGTTE